MSLLPNSEKKALLAPSPGVYRSISYTYRATAASSASTRADGITKAIQSRGCSQTQYWGFRWDLPDMTNWDDVKTVLQQKDLLHPDQCLHLEVEMHDMQ